MKTLMIVLGLALAGPSLAGVIDTAQKAEAAANEAWSAWGGEIGVRWNRDLLAIYGVAVEDGVERTATTDKRRHEWFALRESGGLRFLVRNGECEVARGQLAGRRHVVIEFDSYAAAKACHDSPEYQAAARIRDEASTAEFIIIEGYDG